MRSGVPPPPPPPPPPPVDEEVIEFPVGIMAPGHGPDIFDVQNVGGNDSDDNSDDGGVMNESELLSLEDENDVDTMAVDDFSMDELGGPLSKMSDVDDDDDAAPPSVLPPPPPPPPPHAIL